MLQPVPDPLVQPAAERAILDALPLAVYAVDLHGRITSANHAANHSTAPPPVGRPLWDILGDLAGREELERAMAVLLAGRAPVLRWELPRAGADGGADDGPVLLLQITALHGMPAAGAGDGHDVTGFVVATADITASHRSREALIDTGIALSRTLDMERVYREVAQQARRAIGADAFCVALADDDTAALRVVHQVGYEPESATALETRLKPAWLDALANARVTTHHAPRGLELSAPMTSPEGAIGAITILADAIESPQQLDEARRVLTTLAAQTAAALERGWLVKRVGHKRRLEAIGEVATGIAHELRNPLFGISSAAQLLRFRTRDDPVVEKNVGRILREVERLNRMVTSLLDYGRPNAVRLATGDPDLVWDEVLESQRGRLESGALLLTRERAEPPVRCLLDAEQLAQVFSNVLVNAVDAAPEASDLTLSASALPGGGWRCRLHNGGPAIAPEVLPRVFEIFYSTKSGGTGIGLALCQRILDEHGGTIGIDSAAETGTTVTITLPA